MDLNQGAGVCTNVTADLSGTWIYDGRKYGKAGSSSAPYSVVFKAVPGKPGFYSVLPGDGETEEYRRMNTGVCSDGCSAHVVGSHLDMSGGFAMGATVGPTYATITFANGALWTRPAVACDE